MEKTHGVCGEQGEGHGRERSLGVRAAMQERVEEGWFAGPAPLGYRNGRGHWELPIEVDRETAPLVQQASTS